MSYTELLTESEYNDYTVVKDWSGYLNKFLTENQNLKHRPFILDNIIFETDVEFEYTSYNFSISFKNCYFKQAVKFTTCNLNNRVSFSVCYIDGGMLLLDAIFEDVFWLMNVKIKGEFSTVSGKFKHCNLDLYACDKVNIISPLFERIDVFISAPYTRIIQMSQFEPSNKGTFKLYGHGGVIEEINIFNGAKDSGLLLTDFKTNLFNMENFRNEGQLSLSKISASDSTKAIFLITHSYLGKAEFNQIDFLHFNIVSINESHLIDSLFVNVKWPKNIRALEHVKNVKENKPLNILYFTRQRETYRQLKFAMARQGDIINEQMFHSCEMTAYNKIFTRKQLGTKLIISLSRATSNFGQSITRPLVWLILGHFVLFACLVQKKAFPSFAFSITHASWKGFWEAWKYYFETINPLRKYEPENKFVFMDLMMRIWASYMVYNFIRASRRFIK